MGGGHRNEVWAARLAGRRLVARLSHRSAASLAWETSLLAALADAGIRVPRIVPAADSRLQIDALVVTDWLDSDPPASDGDWRRVADALARLHTVTRDWPQRPGCRSTRELLTANVGGDVQLDRMPPEAASRVRDAWRAVAAEPAAVVHGDPSPDNLRLADGQVGMLDWDEARVDAAILDLAALPLDCSDCLGPGRWAAARRAVDAWEVANAWQAEPDYARRRLARLRSYIAQR